MKPLEQLQRHRQILREEIAECGVREISRWAGINRMRVHRFVHGKGADDAATLYLIAAALGHQINLTQGEQVGNAVEIALSKSTIRRARSRR